MSTADDEFMRAAFDPDFKFEPIVKPVESVDRVLDKILAQADLVVAPCLHCAAQAMPTSEAQVIGFDHLPECPDYAPEV